ncbi:MAG: IS200/IS605 family transposase, partial [Candidatus Harrisonbacteria bacterium CG10_big_fil_rev_8_21_14_0_10_45_28]
YISTVSERGNWAAVEQYVANQGKTMSEPPQLKVFT